MDCMRSSSRALRLVSSNGVDVARATLDVIATLASTTRFRTFVTLLVATELLDDLRDPGPWVVFAPDEAAFGALPDGLLETWFGPDHVERLVDVAENHIARLGRSPRGGARTSLLGEPIDPSATRGEVIACTNGIVVVFDRVRVPRAAQVPVGAMPDEGELTPRRDS